MNSMFSDAVAFNGDLSAWDTSQVTDMRTMFFFARSFTSDMSAWDTSSVTSMYWMFVSATAMLAPPYNCPGSPDPTGEALGACTWPILPIADRAALEALLSACSGTSARIGSTWQAWNGTCVASGAVEQPIGEWDVSLITDMSVLFKYATAFEADLSSWDTGSATDMSWLFSYASSFTSDLSAWDTSSVTNLFAMFFGATAMNAAPYNCPASPTPGSTLNCAWT